MKYTFLFLFFSTLSFGQSEERKPSKLEATPENFEWLMSLKTIGQDDIESVSSLFSAYRKINKDSSLLIAERAMRLTEKEPDEYPHARVLYHYSFSLSDFGKYDAAEKQLIKGKKIAAKLNHQPLLASIFNRLGYVDIKRDRYETAIQHLINAIEIWGQLGKPGKQFTPTYQISHLYYNLSMIPKAEEYLNKASEFAEAADSDNHRLTVNGGRSNIFGGLASKYFKKSKLDLDNSEIFLDSMRHFLKKGIDVDVQSLEVAKKMNSKRAEINTLLSLTAGYNTLEEFEEALKYGKAAETLTKNYGDPNLINRSKYNMAYLYNVMGVPKQALNYALEGLKVVEEAGSDRLIANAHDMLSDIYSEMNDYKEAIDHLKHYQSYQQKIADIENNRVLADAEAKYQTTEKEKEILKQQKDILELENSNDKISTQRNYLMGGGLITGLIGFFGFRLNKIRKERNDKIQFADALIHAQEEERKRIARDLHDGVGQSLLLIKKQMESSHETTLENQQMISSTLEEVRSISQDLHPFQLEKFGLTATIKAIITKIDRSSDLFITSEIDDIDQQVSGKAEINIYRVIQEAFSNIVKHAEATAAKVSIQSSDKDIFIKIQDNGKGFDHELAVIQSKSLGLRTMHERISNTGGTFNIKKGSPEGTVLEIRIPKEKY